jgi:hypothetical protein
MMCRGKIGVDEFTKALQDLWSGEITKHVLYDMTQGETDEFLEPDLLRILNFMKSIPPAQHEKRRGGKTALVASDGHVWGTLRQYKAWLETVPLSWEIQLFRDLDKALDWLNESE